MEDARVKKPRAREYGLDPRWFRPQRRWEVEGLTEEFLSKLSDSDRAWLDKFNQEFHDGKFQAESLHDAQQRLELWRQHRAQKRDAMAWLSYAFDGDIPERGGE